MLLGLATIPFTQFSLILTDIMGDVQDAQMTYYSTTPMIWTLSMESLLYLIIVEYYIQNQKSVHLN